MINFLYQKISLFSILFLMLISLNLMAETAVFGISGSSVTLKMHPNENIMIDVNGFYGEVGRELRIDEMNLSPIMESGVFGTGKLNLDTGKSSFLVNWKVDFDIFDYNTGEFLGADSFSLFFEEKGNVDLLTDEGRFSGKGTIVSNNETSTSFFVDNPSLRIKFVIKIKEFITIVRGMKELEECHDDPVPISFEGGEPEGKEIEIQVRPEGGGGKLYATLSGEIEAICEELSVKLLEFKINIVDDELDLVLETGNEKNNLGMNIWCAQLTQGSDSKYFGKISKLNDELISTKAQSTYSNTSYSRKNFAKAEVLPPGEHFCVIEDIDERGKCTTHCDNLVKVNLNNEFESSNLETAKRLCKEHEDSLLGKNGICIEELISYK